MRKYCLCCMAALTLACEPAGIENIISIDADGTIVGAAFVDVNASGSLDAPDEPARLLSVALVQAGSSDTIARARTDELGNFVFTPVPAGRYEVIVPASGLADTMNVVFRDPPGLPVEQIGPEDDILVTVGDQDSVEVRIGVAYPIVSVETARSLPAGRRVFVAGVVLAGTGTAADSTFFIDGSTRGIAVRRTTSVVSVGDSLLAFGTTATRNGQPVITDASAHVRASDIAFETIELHAATAATAAGGTLDARLVRLSELIATDTTRIGQRFVITAEDPSGAVRVSMPTSFVQAHHAPGWEFSVTGVLVPRSGISGAWEIRPRSPEDLEP